MQPDGICNNCKGPTISPERVTREGYPLTDCGGDCLRCMALYLGDTDCTINYLKYLHEEQRVAIAEL